MGRVAMMADDGSLPEGSSVSATSAGGSSVSVAPTGEITVTSPANDDSTRWDARRSYGLTDRSVVPVPVLFDGGVETNGIFVAYGPRSDRTWESHVFQGFDETGTWRVTMGIDEQDDPSVGFLQVWNPGTSTFGTIQLGSDYVAQGTYFTQYDIRSHGHLTFAGSYSGRSDVMIAHTGSNTSITIRGGANTNPTKGSFIQVRGGDTASNKAGTVVNFGCTWLTDAALADTTIAFNYVSQTQNVDLVKIKPTGQVEITTGNLRMTTPSTPASATDTGAIGEIRWDADYIYVCTATDTWKRAALSTWP